MNVVFEETKTFQEFKISIYEILIKNAANKFLPLAIGKLWKPAKTIQLGLCIWSMHKNHHGDDIVSCITYTNAFKAYTFDGDIIADFDRLKITEAIKRNNEANCNLIGCHNTADNNILLVAGTNSDNGSVLRACKFQKGQLFPYANFDGNKQRVRESIFDSKTNILITAGEGGFVTLWTPLNYESLVSSIRSSNLKMKDKKSNKVTPY